jgi:hypothetical protein
MDSCNFRFLFGAIIFKYRLREYLTRDFSMSLRKIQEKKGSLGPVPDLLEAEVPFTKLVETGLTGDAAGRFTMALARKVIEG